MNGIKKWQWERLVAPRTGARRQREVIEAAFNPEGWPDKVCKSVFEFARSRNLPAYNEFHAGHPVVWDITHGMKRSAYSYGACYCDEHLPDEYRPVMAQVTVPSVPYCECRHEFDDHAAPAQGYSRGACAACECGSYRADGSIVKFPV